MASSQKIKYDKKMGFCFAQISAAIICLAIFKVVLSVADYDDGRTTHSFRYLQYLPHSAKITTPPRDQKVAEDHPVTLICKATGNPLPQIFWRKGGKVIVNTNTRYQITPIHQGSVLRIEKAKPKRDDAQFDCMATNGHAQTVNAYARIEVYPENEVPPQYPKINENPSLKAVERERSTTMVCSATGDPEPEIYWLKDLVPIDLTDPRIKVAPQGTLTIQRSQESDEGKYECVAENSYGSVYSYGANLYVKVRRVPPQFSITPELVYDVKPDDDLNISCAAVGFPMPYIRWRMGNLDLTNEDNLPLGKNTLQLTNIKDSGKYTCMASSDLGNIEAETEVRVQAMPKSPADLIVVDVQATSIRLRWSPSQEEQVNSYTLLYKPKYNMGENYEEINGIESNEYTVTNLQAFTTYEFRVLAVNNIGRGYKSNPLDVATGERPPDGSPQNFTAVGLNARNIRLSWDPPQSEFRNGEIVVYELNYYQRADIGNTEISENTTKTEHFVEGLEAQTDYIFKIRAYTVMGPGPWSNRLPFRTFLQLLPPGPTLLHVHRKSQTAIEASWEAPLINGIEGYKVFYTMVPDDDMDAWQSSEHPPFTQVEISGLEPNSDYAIRVAAILKDRKLTNYSEIIVVKPEQNEVPRMVQSFVARNPTANSVLLEWRPPKEKGFERYQITYVGKKKFMDTQGIENSLIDKDKSIPVPKEETSRLIQHLVSETRYNFNISALYKDGWGPVAVLRLKTSAEAEPKLEAPSLSRVVSEYSIMLNLQAMKEELASQVINYDVIVLPEEFVNLNPSTVPDDQTEEDGPNKHKFTTMHFAEEELMLELETLSNAPPPNRNVPWIAARFDRQLPNQFVLGDNSMAGNGMFKNKPLLPDHLFRVFLKASLAPDNKNIVSEFSPALSTTFMKQQDRIAFLDHASMKLLWIVAPICGSIVILLLLILIIIFIRRSYRRKNENRVYARIKKLKEKNAALTDLN